MNTWYATAKNSMGRLYAIAPDGLSPSDLLKRLIADDPMWRKTGVRLVRRSSDILPYCKRPRFEGDLTWHFVPNLQDNNDDVLDVMDMLSDGYPGCV